MKWTTPSSPPTTEALEIENAALRGERDRQYEENVALIKRIAELEAEVGNLQRKLDDANRDNQLVRRDRDYWHEIIQLQRMRENPDCWREHLHYQLARGLAAQAQVQQAQVLAQQAWAMQGQQSLWHDCTCVPGRAATFGVLQGDN